MNEIEKAQLAVVVVKDLLSIKRKIVAIKIVRQIYSVGVKEAKDFVDAVESPN